MKKRFVITGGAGFIGTNLAHYLVGQGHETVVIDDLSAGDFSRLPSQTIFHKVDVRNTSALVDIFLENDFVVHLAALPRVQFSIENPTLTHDVNVNGTLSVLEAAKQKNVSRVVFATSSSVYGEQETLPLSIDLPAQPKSPYALHKYIGEECMRLWSHLYGVETVSLRFFNVYGPYLDPEGAYALVIGRFLKLTLESKSLTITGDGQQTRDFIHVHDVVSAITKAAYSSSAGKGDVYNVGAGKQTSINEVANLFGGNVEYVAPRIEPKYSQADIKLTKKALDWEPIVSLEDGIVELKREFGIET
jgi:UDP-glucose 4-epimerase